MRCAIPRVSLVVPLRGGGRCFASADMLQWGMGMSFEARPAVALDAVQPGGHDEHRAGGARRRSPRRSSWRCRRAPCRATGAR